MKLHIVEVEPYGSPILVAIVAQKFMGASEGDRLLSRIRPYFPTRPVMLVAVTDNGFKSYAHFQTHVLLSLLQLEYLNLTELDLCVPPPDPELPF